MTINILDFYFGWRWLIPSRSGDIVVFNNLNYNESEYLTSVLAPVGVASQSNEVKISDLETAQVVCVKINAIFSGNWQEKLKQSSFHVREYALLPAGNPRVVVPLSSSSHAVMGLGLHRPGSFRSRLGVSVARFLARLGNFRLLRTQILLIATRDAGVLPIGAMRAQLPIYLEDVTLDFALYLGTADDKRKTVVLPLGKAAPRLILKVAELPKACDAVRNEAATLELLANSSIACNVPQFGGLVKSGSTLTLYQEYRPRQQIGRRKMAKAVVAFLASLTDVSRKSLSLQDYLNVPIDFPKSLCVVRAYNSLKMRLAILARSDAMLWLHRNHGDFAPWNCAWTERGLFVFDWEESCDEALALGDAFYYVIAPALHIQKKPSARKTLNATLLVAGQVAAASGLGNLDIRLYLALWLLKRVNKADLYGDILILLERDWC